MLNKYNIDYNNYINTYEDIQIILKNTEKESIKRKFCWNHWEKFGKKEGRIMNEINYINENSICIFHCGNINIFNEILEEFPKLAKMKLLITYFNKKYKKLIINHEINLNILHIMKVDNKGCDIGPFLLSIQYLLENKFLYNKETKFLKIHTKSKKIWRNLLIKDILNINNTEFNYDIPCIYGSHKYIYNQNKSVNFLYMKKIFERNESMEEKEFLQYFDLYYNEFVDNKINDNNKFQDLNFNYNFYKKYEFYLDSNFKTKENYIDHWNNFGKNEYHRKSNVNYIKQWANKECYFVAGTIFAFNLSWLNLFNKFNINYEYSILENGYLDNSNETKLHSWEYYFGLIVFLNNGYIFGLDYNKIINKYSNLLLKNKPPLFSQIYQPFKKAKIAFFMLVPGNDARSGGYRTLLNYINILNKNNHNIDIYFGTPYTEKQINDNIYNLNEFGIPKCSNWFSNDNNIHKIIENIKKYNILDIEKNNYYIGLACQRKYDILVANAWQVSECVYLNKHMTKHLYYIIQDREELFYNNNYLKKLVLKTYHHEFKYYCITKYLENYFKNTYHLPNITSSLMGINLNKYFNKNQERELSIAIPYYDLEKPNRLPNLVEKIIHILSSNNIKCYIYPTNFHNNMNSKYIINLGTLTEIELNNLYNKVKVGIIFSNSNPSRLPFEMYASGLHVIEYECEFTKYDLPEQYFTKIKNENNILNIVLELFRKKYDNSFINNLDIENDYKKFLNYIEESL